MVLIILIDNLHAGGHSNLGTLSPRVLLQQFSNNLITNYFIFTQVTSESQYPQYARARASLSGSNDFPLHPPRQANC